MGGTSCDVCVVEDGAVRRTDSRRVDGRVIQLPMVDVHTVGAGGGSIATIDSGGLLKVGPRSAGADPGPVCYGKGNDEPAVTDANVVLQTLNPQYLLGGRMADLLGRRLMLVTGLVVFAGASLTGGLAHSESLLVAARFAQGVGAAMLSPAALSTLTSTFRSTRDRNTALGVWAAVSGIGSSFFFSSLAGSGAFFFTYTTTAAIPKPSAKNPTTPRLNQ